MYAMADTLVRPVRLPLGGTAHPLYGALLPVPIVCFIGALASDLVYTGNPAMMWIDFSSWLLLAGLIGGGFALLVLMIDMIRLGHHRPAMLVTHFVLLVTAWVVEVFNSLIHARDGWTAVVPTGITLSITAAVLNLVAGWFWQSARYAAAGDIR
jgi:uncharacterized membrane protein